MLGPINEKLDRLISLGLIDKWTKEIVANSSNCVTVSKMVDSHTSDKRESPFSIEEMATFFFIILIGHFIATLGFVIEAIKKKCSKNEQTDEVIII